jgi:uncharacterized damage-inducible protein DinB
MTKPEIEKLFAYDRWANGRMFAALSSLTDEQFTRELNSGGSFRSVRDVAVHIVASEWGWLTTWKTLPPDEESLDAIWDANEALFPAAHFSDAAAVAARWREIETAVHTFVDALDDATLAHMLPHSDNVRLPLAETPVHLANHSTYHRGQVAILMRQLHAKPPATDYTRFLVETSRQRGGLIFL